MLKSSRTRVPEGSVLMLLGLTVSLPVGCVVGKAVGVRVAVGAGGVFVAVAPIEVGTMTGVEVGAGGNVPSVDAWIAFAKFWI